MAWTDREGDAGNDGGSAGAGAFVRALRLNDAGRHDLARRALLEGLAADPDDADLHGELARTALLQDQHAEAERLAREALARDPRHPIASMVLGGALTGLGRHSEAERVLLEALRADPRDARLLHQYGWLLYRVGRLDKAERVARAALEVDPELGDAHQLLALVLGEAKRRAEALAHGQRGLALDPAEADAHLVQGLALFQNGHPFEARRHLREALRSHPTPQAEAAFREVDALCRPPGIPLYWWSHFAERIPGQALTVWIVFLVGVPLARSFGAPEVVLGAVVIAYVLFMLYTWIGGPLAKLWVRVFPAR